MGREFFVRAFVIVASFGQNFFHFKLFNSLFNLILVVLVLAMMMDFRLFFYLYHLLVFNRITFFPLYMLFDSLLSGGQTFNNLSR